MIRIRPLEWLHMEVRGSGRLGNSKVSGTLYLTPKRVIIQAGGPVWEANLSDLTIQPDGKTAIMTADSREVTWTSKTPITWWGNAIRFWQKGVIQNAKPTDGPPPSFGDITELPEIIRNSKWSIRQYNQQELSAEGIPGEIPTSDEFTRTSYRTNMILAALRHDGFPDGPPPAFYQMMLRRHALTHVTNLVWSWRSALRYVTAIISGKGRQASTDKIGLVFASWPDRLFEPKPLTVDPGWYHQMNPASCGGHPYQMLEQCRRMMPIITRVADELHDHQGHNPYLRMRQLFEAIRDNQPLPTPPREALRLARAATNQPW